MSSRLKNILHFTAVPAGAAVALPHKLNWSGRPVVPDHAEASASGWEITADDQNITIVGIGGDVDILVESWHTFERAFGAAQTVKLTPQPFVPAGSDELPTPPFEGTPNVIIYARTTGSDTTGNGQSVATAYRTFQRAIRDVPLTIPALVQYWVDITGITETLPPDYAVPPIKSSGYYGAGPSPVRGGRDFFGALNIASDVVPFTGIPLADTVISLGALVSNTADPVTGLRIIVVNKVYAPGVLRNAFLLSSTPGNGKRGNPIFDNVAGPGPGQTTITVTTNTTNPLFTAPFLIAEPGATLIAQNSNESFTGLSFRHIDSLSLQGIRFRNADPDQFAYSMNVIDIATPTMSLCDVEGIYIGPKVSYFFPGGTIFRNKQIESEGQTTLAFFGGVWTDMPTLYTYDVLELTLNGCCVRNCAAIGPRPTVVFTPAFSTIGSGTPMIVNVIGLEIQGSVVDSDFGTPGFGVFNIGPGLAVANVKINGCAADAIYVNGGNAVIQTVAGTGNGGVGILADKGAQVSVDAATTVQGALVTDGVKAGSLAAVAYAALVPGVAQQYDLQPADINTVATGARIFRV